MLGVLSLIQNEIFVQDSLQEVVSNLNLIPIKINSTKVVRVNHPNVQTHSQTETDVQTHSRKRQMYRHTRGQRQMYRHTQAQNRLLFPLSWLDIGEN